MERELIVQISRHEGGMDERLVSERKKRQRMSARGKELENLMLKEDMKNR